ncbi:hypothetical protein E8E13_002673 [Curvularia kusanoi]|uniref:Uncharacterized protein n=1 Tax=Curvularia kusanoi TaxID=90978 RepID=A0A9P4T4L8_CURKU|nr:hypothetical protein E8E13_002673 [Curvularia kusanoi]
MYRTFSLFVFVLAAPSINRLVQAVHHVPLAISDAQKILEADSYETSERLRVTVDEQDAKVYWTLSTWQDNSISCTTPADKKWTDWVYHEACQQYNFNKLSFDTEKDGIYRLCVYESKTCSGLSHLRYETSSSKKCVQVKHPWAKSWKIVRARENCD